MNINKTRGLFGSTLLGVSIAFASSAAGQVVELIEADGLEDQTLNGDVISGWIFQDVGFSDPACANYMYVYPDNPGSVPTENRNYFTVAKNAGGGPASTEAYTEYSRVGLSDQGIGGNMSLNVYATGASNDSNVGCHRSTLFKTVNTTQLSERGITPESGNFKINAKVMMNPFSEVRELAEGHKVGVALVIINNEVTPAEDNGWGIMVNTTREVALAGDVVTVAEDFEIDLGDVQDITIRAGVYNQTVYQQYDGTYWDDFSLTVGDLTEEQLAEQAACNDTGVLRFEDAFGYTDTVKKSDMVTCLTDTYTWPTGAEDWAGFGDTKRGDQYPFYFPSQPGSVTFECSTESGTADIKFKFEEAPDPNGTNPGQPSYFTDSVQCSSAESRASKSVSIPVSEQVWGNMILYVETRDVPVQVKNIKVNGSQEYVAPVPALPIWGLLGLTGLVGVMGMRRRRKQ